jgi:hypothetical protein
MGMAVGVLRRYVCGCSDLDIYQVLGLTSETISEGVLVNRKSDTREVFANSSEAWRWHPVIAVTSGLAVVVEGAWVALGAIWTLLAAAEAAEKTRPHPASDKAEVYILRLTSRREADG